MTTTDRHGNTVSTRNANAIAGYDRAAAMMLGFRADPLTEIEAAIAEQPDFAMGHAFRAGILAMSMEAPLIPLVLESVVAGEAVPAANDRERAHLAAARAWAEGDLDLAHYRYAQIAAGYPRDLFAQQAAHQFDFFLGCPEGLRERPKAALRAWRGEEEGVAWLLGMHAFGLEECGDYAAAESTGRMAVALQPRDAWATHAVAHVLEMQGKHIEGAAWLMDQEAEWSQGDILAVHNWWHLALFHLEEGDIDAVLGIYDRAIAPGRPGKPAIELVDASAMLWRLWLRGVDTGLRFTALSDAWDAIGGAGFYAFSDLHAAMAHVGAGRQDRCAALVEAMRNAASGGGTNATLTSKVGLPLVAGVLAFGRGSWAQTVACIEPVRPSALAFGGSNAQRDVLTLTVLEAALRGGDLGRARTIVGKRLAARPMSPFARTLALRAHRPDLAA